MASLSFVKKEGSFTCKHPLPENVYEVYMQYWRGERFEIVD
jgi:hypothetical protein